MKKTKVSIIILSYNNASYTKNCIDSILSFNENGNIEIIVVDNASSKKTIEILQNYKSNSKIKLILNDNNYGFSKGNNVGMTASKGEYIILLNNDTIVTPGWIERLIYHVDKPGVGLVGPVTNSIGNEAKIDISYDPKNIQEMELKAKEYTSKHWNQTLELNNIAAFCWIMKRETYKEIGGFDERFGRAFFEDDDYCVRIKKAGLKIVCAEDVFIHHYHNATVGTLNNTKYKRLFEENKKKFEQKWGIKWLPHTFRKKNLLHKVFSRIKPLFKQRTRC